MTLKEALDLTNIKYNIVLSNKNGKKYYYNYIYQFEESEDYEKLLSLELINIDFNGGKTIFMVGRF